MLQACRRCGPAPRRFQASDRSICKLRTRASDQQSPGASPASTTDADVKVQATISTLDALLGPQASPASTSSTARSSSSIDDAPASKASSSGRPAAPAWPTVPGAAPAKPAAPAARKDAGPGFEGVMGFSGLAPEVINGRAAMIGFLIAISNELNNGESIFSQAVSGGAAQALIVILAVTVASFAPAIRGTPLSEVFNQGKNKAEWGPFTAFAEGLNGRLAMVGLGLMLFFEGAGPSAFFMN